MEVSFQNRKLGERCCSMQKLQRAYGDTQARLVARRLVVLRAAANLGEFWPPYKQPERCHELKGDRAGQLAMDLVQPSRLLFKPAHNPVPQQPAGGLDWRQVTAITIIGVEDYHG